MKKNIAKAKVTRKFISHIQSFMNNMSIFPASKRVVVGVSGGMDSMVLLFVLWRLREGGAIKEIRALHINHGTRKKENELDAQLVTAYLKQLKIELVVKKIELNANLPNFEEKARKERYKIFKQFVENGDFLYTAHHIDDSFEWSLLSRFKSGSLRSGLGIPVINGQVARPFMCVTKNQITKIANLNNIPYREDSSNLDIRFERNYIRKSVVVDIKKRFPGYLKHYVYYSNKLARKLNLNRTDHINTLKNSDGLRVVKDSIDGVLVSLRGLTNDFSFHEEALIRIIHNLSSEKRGTLSLQIIKLIEAVKNGKQGPLSFSGGVLGYISYNSIYFINKLYLKNFAKRDEDLLSILKKQYDLKEKEGSFLEINSLNQMDQVLSNGKSLFPFLCINGDRDTERLLPSSKREHPLWPKSTKFLVERKIWFNYIPRVLYCWQKSEKNTTKVKVMVITQ